MTDLFQSRGGATFSPCRTYRYALHRELDGTRGTCLFVMLNPSTADEVQNDPTVERCERRARMWGFGRLAVANIFALRSTDPRGLYTHPEPIGPENDDAIKQLALAAELVICAWGVHGKFKERGKAVLAMLRNAKIAPHALRMTRGGEPSHPLYIGYSNEPRIIYP